MITIILTRNKRQERQRRTIRRAEEIKMMISDNNDIMIKVMAWYIYSNLYLVCSSSICYEYDDYNYNIPPTYPHSTTILKYPHYYAVSLSLTK